MHTILKMRNSIQNYAWGSKSAIAQLMKRPAPTEKPEAELWLGAHPKSPSHVRVDDRWLDLEQWIAQNPNKILGPGVNAHFNGVLPYLLKILAAAQPLSIQAHPGKEQARQGYEIENKRKVPMDAGHRNYKDPNHKPECICALSPFWALCGFRNNVNILYILRDIWPYNYSNDLAVLEKVDLKTFFKQLMTMDSDRRSTLICELIKNIPPDTNQNAIHRWMVQFQTLYPGDVGVLSPALLNLIELKPGEALALPAGQLHAYLDGLGIELMANSDNVLRGGLTPKHVDVPELIKVLDFNPNTPEILKPVGKSNHERFYPSVSEEFKLFVVQPEPGKDYVVKDRPQMPEILLCTSGRALVRSQSIEKPVELSQGHSVFVTAAADQYEIQGEAVIYKAAVNLSP